MGFGEVVVGVDCVLDFGCYVFVEFFGVFVVGDCFVIFDLLWFDGDVGVVWFEVW